MTDRLGRADLHIHTLASDGTAGVVEILDHVERHTEPRRHRDHRPRADRRGARRPGHGPRPRPVVRGRRRRGGDDARRAPARRSSSSRTVKPFRIAAHDDRRDPRPGRARDPGASARALPAVRPGLRAAPAARRRAALPSRRPRGVQPDDARRGRGTQRVVRFANEHGLARVGNSDAHALDAIGHRLHDVPRARRRGPARDPSRRPRPPPRDVPSGRAQLETFGAQLRKYSRDARASVGGRLRRDGTRRDLGYPGDGAGSPASGRTLLTVRRAERPRRMKIGLVTPYIYPLPGGVNQHVRYLYENLRLRGHDVRIITQQPRPRSAPREGDVIRIGRGFSLPANGSVGTHHPVAAVPGRRSGRSWSASSSTCSTSTSRSCRSCRSSCWGCRTASTWRRSTPSAASRRRTRSAPGCMRPVRRTGSMAGSPFPRWRATSSTASSRATTRSSPTASTWAASQRAVPIARWQDGTKNILFVGRFEIAQGPPGPAQGVPDPAQDRLRCRLLVAGGGPQEREIRRYMLTRKLGGVEFLGRVSDDERDALFKTADVYCSPATGRESFGIVLLEAMAAGTPIVCQRHPRLQGRGPSRPRGPARAARNPKALAGALAELLPRRRAARGDGRAGPRAGAGIQLGARHREGRRLLRLRDPPPRRAGQAARRASTPRSRRRPRIPLAVA